jgi:hypothetical protein
VVQDLNQAALMASDYLSHHERRNAAARVETLERIKAEFAYLSGLTLTQPQVNRLFHLEGGLGERVMEQLVDTGFLCRSEDGGFAQRRDKPEA